MPLIHSRDPVGSLKAFGRKASNPQTRPGFRSPMTWQGFFGGLLVALAPTWMLFAVSYPIIGTILPALVVGTLIEWYRVVEVE